MPCMPHGNAFNARAQGRVAGPVRAVVQGMSHQLMCGAAMLTGHFAAAHSRRAAEIVAHDATNGVLMLGALACGVLGLKGWRNSRGGLAGPWEKATAYSLIGAAGIGMAAMHVPGMGMHHHHSYEDHSAAAAAWLDGLDDAKRREYEGHAHAMRISLEEYAERYCGTPTALPPSNPVRRPD